MLTLNVSSFQAGEKCTPDNLEHSNCFLLSIIQKNYCDLLPQTLDIISVSKVAFYCQSCVNCKIIFVNLLLIIHVLQVKVSVACVR